ncbi:MAG: cytochrome C [Cyclobacteriaceae bacterium]
MMSEQEEIRKIVQAISKLTYLVLTVTGLVVALLLYYMIDPRMSALAISVEETTTSLLGENSDKIEDGIHLRTGLIEAEGLMAVVNNCTNCHSAKLVIQNRMNKERWVSTIRWMQRTQNLWQLGDQEDVIINYLTTNYPPQKKGRRQALNEIEWYALED